MSWGAARAECVSVRGREVSAGLGGRTCEIDAFLVFKSDIFNLVHLQEVIRASLVQSTCQKR